MKTNTGITVPELLAPAGNMEALQAAVKAGADAVYVGGSLFSARAYAGNFDTEELKAALDYCHIYGVKLYLALNTLLKENEIGLVADYLDPLYRYGLDGIIVQDMGVAALVARDFPDLPLHASTQMSISSHYGAALLKSLGFMRVVPAREVSLEEIISIKKQVDIEIEAFIHGAMCYCYSGRCLFSSFAGGRSGNRGRCAQPCRQRFEYPQGSAYIMSMKDMCTLDILPELIDAGIDSFKIEGRMKKPEYVASAVAAYRRAIDEHTAKNGLKHSGSNEAGGALQISKQNLMDIYNRGGFSTGYYKEQRGRDMLAYERPNHTGLLVGKIEKIQPPFISVRLVQDVNPQDVLEIRSNNIPVLELQSGSGAAAGKLLQLKGREFKSLRKGMDVYRTRNNMLINQIRTRILEPDMVLKAEALVRAYVGEPLTITVSLPEGECGLSGNGEYTVSGAVVTRAENRPTPEEKILEKMQKTGGSGVQLEVTCDIGTGVFIPMSVLNELRREAVDGFRKMLAEGYHRK